MEASAGFSAVSTESWTSVQGRFQRVPLGYRKIGTIGSTGDSLFIDLTKENAWIADPGWIKREGIQSFAGHPLVFRGKILGVLGLFSREGLLRARHGLAPYVRRSGGCGHRKRPRLRRNRESASRTRTARTRAQASDRCCASAHVYLGSGLQRPVSESQFIGVFRTNPSKTTRRVSRERNSS